ncbi:MAG TPA: transglutaminase-like domain-containing protein, partial [Candidatus Edwardsbacteria bacterium]|nr:transglutaminase-like domain-containing protein [Candidatus Edwardsbacteria bacterium]
GQAITQTVPIDGPIYLADALDGMIAGRTLKVGDRFDFSTFDPSTQSVQPSRVTVAARETLDVDSLLVPALRLTVEFSGTASTAWVDSAGRTLKEEGPMGIVMLAEPRDKAIALPDRPAEIDLLTSLSVPVAGRELTDPRAASELRVRLSGMDWSGMDVGGGRQLIADSSAHIVVVTREQEPVAAAPALAAADLAPYLAATPLIQCNDLKIRSTARTIIINKRTDWDRAVAIADWVYQNLAKQMTVSLPSAVEVLQSRRGDCNEHATLFAALARAAGIPAKLCLGVVYLDGRFYYHAWNAVWCGRWIEIDPTFGQHPADAARLRLVEGDLTRQNRLLPAFGNLSIEILDAK